MESNTGDEDTITETKDSRGQGGRQWTSKTWPGMRLLRIDEIHNNSNNESDEAGMDAAMVRLKVNSMRQIWNI